MGGIEAPRGTWLGTWRSRSTYLARFYLELLQSVGVSMKTRFLVGFPSFGSSNVGVWRRRIDRSAYYVAGSTKGCKKVPFRESGEIWRQALRERRETALGTPNFFNRVGAEFRRLEEVI